MLKSNTTHKILIGIARALIFFLVSNYAMFVLSGYLTFLQNIGLSGIILTINLFIAGIITGSYIKCNGFMFGFIAGATIYLTTCIGIIIYLYFFKDFQLFDKLELIKALGNFSLFLIAAIAPIAVISALISGMGGWLGQYLSHK